jgi:UDP-N-acetylglucosamine--N-acetylmuramyl-(pentapeptide) pyrophosphoryl-undecaprenol N-acetylglucosamine transferase
MRVIISGGGSGGHIFPAIAIANAIKKIEPSTEFLFVGAKGKIEMEKVPKAGYPIKGLWISGIDRKLTFRNMVFPFKLVSSLFNSSRIIRSFRPDIAVGVGGFASGPLLYTAARKGVPTVIQEQNSYPGITNKLLASKVDKICVAYEGMERFFPAEKIKLLGNPVRREIFENDRQRSEVLEGMGLNPDNKTVLVFGGSLGARTLNNAMASKANVMTGMKEVNWIWQVGKLYHTEFKRLKIDQAPNIVMLPFIDDMPGVYKAADVVVCRAGALTISELQVVGKAAILIPSPNVAEDHQTKNAMALVEKGAAKIVVDNRAVNELMDEILSLLYDTKECQKLSEEIKKLGKKNAAMKIAEVIIDIAKK